MIRATDATNRSVESLPPLSTVDAHGLTLGIVATRWHADISTRLLARALACAAASGVRDATVVKVPGPLDLPVVCQQLARNHDAVVALGGLIRGDMPHFEFVADAVVSGLARVCTDSSTPIGDGVLTCDTLDQALSRCGDTEGSSEDTGWETTVAALQTALVLADLRHRD